MTPYASFGRPKASSSRLGSPCLREGECELEPDYEGVEPNGQLNND